jgi:ubiquitin-protein ligase E3 A
VRLYLDWFLNKSIEKQFRPFYRGFHKVVTGDGIRLFNGEELMTLICGSPHLDFNELEAVTHYEDGYTKESSVIK